MTASPLPESDTSSRPYPLSLSPGVTDPSSPAHSKAPSNCEGIYSIHLSKENYQVLIYCEPRQAHRIPAPAGSLGTEMSPWQGRYPSPRALGFQTHL